MPANAAQSAARTRVEGAPSAAPGSQTLARGLSALQAIADAPGGLTVQQVADHLGAHRTIAYRLLATLSQFRYVAKGRRPLPARGGARGPRIVVRQQRAPTGHPDPADAGRRTRHHGVAPRCRG